MDLRIMIFQDASWIKVNDGPMRANKSIYSTRVALYKFSLLFIWKKVKI
jgi:hypothetical protein